MLNSPRWLLALISISFGIYHAVLGALAWQSYDNLWWHWLSILIYLITFVVSVSATEGLAIGRGFGAAVATGAVSTVIISNLGIHHGHTDPYSTWYVGGMAALLGVLAARGQSPLAWLAALMVAWLVYAEGGVESLAEVGLEGIAILIAAASATAAALKRADQEIQELRLAEIASEAGIASVGAASAERRRRLNNVMERALPALSFISSKKGNITADEQKELRQLEASLRDDIRGRMLLNDAVRSAAHAARTRGIEVIFMDEGGLQQVTDRELQNILEKVAKAISSVKAGKIVVRSPKGEKWLVTVAATRPGTQAPDLWLRF